MLRYLMNLGFQTKLRIFILSLLVILFTFGGFLVYYAQKARILNTVSENAEIFMNDLSTILDLSAKQYPAFETNSPVYRSMKPVFDSRKYFEGGQVYLIGFDGNYLLHPTREGRNGIKDNANEAMLKDLLNRGAYEFKDSNGYENRQYFRLFEPWKAFVVITYTEEYLFQSLERSRNMVVLIFIISVTIALSLLYLLLRPFSKTLGELNKALNTMSTGEPVDELTVRSEDEVGTIVHFVNKLIHGLRQTADFSVQIGQGNLDSEYKPLSGKDVLGNSMLQMRESLKHATEEEKRRKKEDDERNWVAMGLAKFGEILRTNYTSTRELGEVVIQNLVKYLKANQGGIFQLNDELESDKHLELLAAFAYDRKKYLTKKVLFGEGLVGACAIEKQTIYMTEIPQGYISITSGLGDANPDSLLIVPMRLEEKVFGVIEIASFRKFEKYEIEFVEKVAESIASTLSTVKINTKTTQLLQQSQQQAEEMAAQEEEMRQNMEELQATQEESARREFELLNLIGSLDKHFLRSELSPDGKIISANDLFFSTLEYSLGDLKNKHITEIFPAGEAGDFSTEWKKVLDGKEFQGVFAAKSHGGDKVWLMISLSPVQNRDGMLSKVLSFAIDVTGQKQNEEELRNQMSHFEQLKEQWLRSVKGRKAK